MGHLLEVRRDVRVVKLDVDHVLNVAFGRIKLAATRCCTSSGGRVGNRGSSKSQQHGQNKYKGENGSRGSKHPVHSSSFVSSLKSKPQFTKEQNQEVIRWGFIVLVSDPMTK